MFFNLAGLGFVLSLDNFRTSVTLGPLRFRWLRSVLVAAVFGFFDGLAPLVGILLGDYLRREIAGPVSGVAGPAVLGLYGLFLLVQAAREKAQEDAGYLWCVFGLPVPLSLDNLVAGTGLGLAGIPPLVPAALFGAITFVMSLAGLQLGRGISYLVPIRIRWEYVTGVALVTEAVLLGLGVLD
ncbi:MAG TPA: manganese efflux pump [Streptosporangiaceae bacterium]|nr:manganese efflux pump [Streptosporangiaceae bacterium]